MPEFETKTDQSDGTERVVLTRSVLSDPSQAVAVLQELWDSPMPLSQRYARLLEQRAVRVFRTERRCAAVASAPWAFLLALQSLGLRPGDRVLVPALGAETVLEALRFGGFQPVPADIDPDSLTLDPLDAARRMEPRVRAIVGVHLHGAPCQVDAILALAKANGLKALFDASGALGARWQGRSVSEFGDAVVFGMEAPLNADGAALVVLKDDATALELERLRSQHRGLIAVVPELQAALAWLALPDVESAVAYRQALVTLYRQRLGGLAVASVPEGGQSAWSGLAVRVDGPAAVQLQLLAAGVDSALLGSGAAAWLAQDLPQAQHALGHWLRLPLHRSMTRAQVDRVAAAMAPSNH